MQPSFQPIILPVPHFYRPERGECLAASVAMVLAHYKININYTRILKVLAVQKTLGTPFPNIRKLTELGITVFYQRGSIYELYAHLQNGNPVIIPVKTQELPYWDENTDHAVVLVGMNSQMVYLNDPVFENPTIPVTQGDFDLAWLERDEY